MIIDVKNFFLATIEKELQKSKKPIEVGNRLGDILKSTEQRAVEFTLPVSIKKWSNSKNLSFWQRVIKDPVKLHELRRIGVSVANTLRPLAGNVFVMWIAEILNRQFVLEKLPLRAIISGKIKSQIARKLVREVRNAKGESTVQDLKPDIDIVVVKQIKNKQKPIAIISAKTTLAERILQTITWKRLLAELPKEVRDVKIFLVTAWETFQQGEVNRERVQELDGVYVCNKFVNEYKKIKVFSKLIEDLKEL